MPPPSQCCTARCDGVLWPRLWVPAILPSDRGGLLMLRSLAISSLLLAGTVSVASASDVYRWVDDHGGVHYSDQWVPGSELIKSTKPRPNSASSSDTSRRTAESPKYATSSSPTSPGGQSDATQAVKQDVAKVREQQCKEAKDRYEKAIQARRIFKNTGEKNKETGEEERQYLTDEEADALRVKARQDMEDLCGSSAK